MRVDKVIIYSSKSGCISFYSDKLCNNEVKRPLNCRQLWNQQELHILSGSKRKFTLPRGRVMQRLLELDGF